MADLMKNTHKKSLTSNRYMSDSSSAQNYDDFLNNNNSKIDVKATPLPPKSITAIKDDDWKSLQSSITYLFHKKKLQKLELDVLNEKVRNVRDSKMGPRILEYYKDSILKKGMIVLRENIKEKKGNDLLDRLSEVWSQFYTSILPTLQAIFYPIQEQGVYIRSVTLIGFRDIVLMKTKIFDALIPGEKSSSEIKQMLLVLASIHDTHPPSENYMKLEKLVSRVVSPYLGFDGLYTKSRSPTIKRISSDLTKPQNGSIKERKVSRSQLIREEMSKKLRRSSLSSATQNTINNSENIVSNSSDLKPKEGSFRARFRIGSSSTTSSANKSVTESPDLSKSILDTDMVSYMNERQQKWKHREEMLVSESLI